MICQNSWCLIKQQTFQTILEFQDVFIYFWLVVPYFYYLAIFVLLPAAIFLFHLLNGYFWDLYSLDRFYWFCSISASSMFCITETIIFVEFSTACVGFLLSLLFKILPLCHLISSPSYLETCLGICFFSSQKRLVCVGQISMLLPLLPPPSVIAIFSI